MSDCSDEEVIIFFLISWGGAPMLQAVNRDDDDLLPLAPHAPSHLVRPFSVRKLLAKSAVFSTIGQILERLYTILSPLEMS